MAPVLQQTVAAVEGALVAQGLLAEGGDPERDAYRVNDRIDDPDLRNRHLLAGI